MLAYFEPDFDLVLVSFFWIEALFILITFY